MDEVQPKGRKLPKIKDWNKNVLKTGENIPAFFYCEYFIKGKGEESVRY